MAKGKRQVQFDASGERLLALGLSFTPKRGYDGVLRFRCFPNSISVTFDAGRSDIPPVQLESLERLVAEQSQAIHKSVLRGVLGGLAEWYEKYAPEERCPTLKWVRENCRVGSVYFEPPSQTQSPVHPRFGLFASRGPDDEHPFHFRVTWSDGCWEVERTE